MAAQALLQDICAYLDSLAKSQLLDTLCKELSYVIRLENANEPSSPAEELAVARKHHMLAAAASHETLHLDKPSLEDASGELNA